MQKIKRNDRVTNAPLLERLRQSVKLPSTYNFFKLARVLVCFNHVARFIVNADHRIV
jgi:hypothetical protein